MRELTSLIVGIEGISRHSFNGWDESYDIILLTNRNFAEVTKTELEELEPGASTRIFGAESEQKSGTCAGSGTFGLIRNFYSSSGAWPAAGWMRQWRLIRSWRQIF